MNFATAAVLVDCLIFVKLLINLIYAGGRKTAGYPYCNGSQQIVCGIIRHDLKCHGTKDPSQYAAYRREPFVVQRRTFQNGRHKIANDGYRRDRCQSHDIHWPFNPFCNSAILGMHVNWPCWIICLVGRVSWHPKTSPTVLFIRKDIKDRFWY